MKKLVQTSNGQYYMVTAESLTVLNRHSGFFDKALFDEPGSQVRLSPLLREGPLVIISDKEAVKAFSTIGFIPDQDKFETCTVEDLYDTHKLLKKNLERLGYIICYINTGKQIPSTDIDFLNHCAPVIGLKLLARLVDEAAKDVYQRSKDIGALEDCIYAMYEQYTIEIEGYANARKEDEEKKSKKKTGKVKTIFNTAKDYLNSKFTNKK